MLNDITPPSSAQRDAKTGKFVSRNTSSRGRPKGSRNRLGEEFLSDLQADWRAHGPKVIAAMRKQDPVSYAKIIAHLMPAQLEIGINTDFNTCNTIEEVIEMLIDNTDSLEDLLALIDQTRAEVVERINANAPEMPPVVLMLPPPRESGENSQTTLSATLPST